MSKRKKDLRVVTYAFLSLISFILAFIIDWLFVIPAVIFMEMGRRRLLNQPVKEDSSEK